MNYIVIDLEFNQAYDFENNCPKPHIKGCRFEIIQIGAVKLNENFETLDIFNAYIKPNIYKKIHPYVKKITSITDEVLENKENFKDEVIKFFNFIGKNDDYIICSWGNCDIKVLYKNLKYYNLIKKDKLILKYIDIQSIANSYLKCNKGNNISLKSATEILGINYKGDFHNALNDAIYTAKIFQKLYKELPKDKINIKIFNSQYIN